MILLIKKNVIEPSESGQADIVIGSRFIKKGFQPSGIRRVGSNFLSVLIRLCCGTKVLDGTSGFWAFNRKYIKSMQRNIQ